MYIILFNSFNNFTIIDQEFSTYWLYPLSLPKHFLLHIEAPKVFNYFSELRCKGGCLWRLMVVIREAKKVQNESTWSLQWVLCTAIWIQHILQSLELPFIKIFNVKKGEPKKVQVTEGLKDKISLWGQECYQNT